MSGTDSNERRIEAQRWLSIADQDLLAARNGLSVSPRLIGIAAYHCQQAAEKIVKGVLVAKGVDFPKTHDLAKLSALVTPAAPALAAAFAVFEPITVWGFAYRYPFEEESSLAPPSVSTMTL